MITPPWALALAYWLHMLATVVWIGGLAALSVLVLPAARKALDSRTFAALLGGIQERLDALGWFCLILLAGTGMFQMASNPNYVGFLAITNRWAMAILLKHLMFLAMAGLSAYLTWGVMPQLKRAALRQAHLPQKDADSREITHLMRQETLLMQLNLILGIMILALTSIARAS